MIVVLNDSTKTLKTWLSVLEPHDVKLYSHPNFLLNDMYRDPSAFNTAHTYIFDRIFHEDDIFEMTQLKEIRSLSPREDALFLLSSRHHEPGEKIKGFDFVISSIPTSFENIEKLLKKLRLKNETETLFKKICAPFYHFFS